MHDEKKVTIHSDGIGHGNHTVVLFNGEIVQGVQAISYNVAAGELAEISLEIRHAELKVEGSVTIVYFACPFCSWSHDHECSKPDLSDPGS